MAFKVWWRLSAMMLLQYAVGGAWSAIAGRYFKTLGFEPAVIAVLLSFVPMATVLSPFLAGQLADRRFDSRAVLAVLNLLGAVLLVGLARQNTLAGVWPLLFLYALCYAPTAALTNAIAFRHMPDTSRFGLVRVWGTIGWGLSSLALTQWRTVARPPVHGDLFLLAAALSVAIGLLCFALPRTPPRREAANPWAFMEAIAMLRQPGFAVFMAVALVAASALDFHYILASQYLAAPVALHGIGISDAQLPRVMAIAQASEVVVMLLQPVVLPRLGVRWGVMLGTLAWTARYAVFAFSHSPTAVVSSLALHGLCIVFFFVTVFIYVDRIAPKDIRASAQSFTTLVVFGLGRVVGSWFAGWVAQRYTVHVGPNQAITNWQAVFLVPCVMMLVCSVAFPALFREAPSERAPSALEVAAAEAEAAPAQAAEP